MDFRARKIHHQSNPSNPGTKHLDMLGVGSSPRVRGTLVLVLESPIFSRFIPACAGNTSLQVAARPGNSVHPRVCGEHCVNMRRYAGLFGSSPRVRGTHHDAGSQQTQDRFIPACAGNTHKPSGLWLCAAVHPRVCGEHWYLPRRLGCCYGSSPRVRGTHDIP
ncbi:hypothetical protein S101468_03287 (plasmid) [Acetobacter pasteurianus subsp. pasteurianus]|uniref:Uncharacterized protein n=1 Tax=Acetobacter pasteurianus subsp. pasteurianus TaxID=481145 RepID=A0AAC9SU38_ACEPA|nr:hypothetical protein S101468_03287 [Acetobacter pasteurianus subsp. pasteurianus]